MPTVRVNVKWARENYRDITLDTEQPPSAFKNQLYELTGVPPQRQRVLVGGRVIGDSWSVAELTENCTVLLMGSKGDLPSAPVTKTVFAEDLTQSELTKAYSLPAGIVNLGNTCYLNATIQCLKTIPELRAAIKKSKGHFSFTSVSKQNFMIALRDQCELMEKGVTVPPVGLVHSLHNLFPHFSEKDSKGTWKQQDANEVWIEIVNILNTKLESVDTGKSVVDQFMTGMFEIQFKCKDTDSEPTVKVEETFLQLSCFISQEVKFVATGILSKLNEDIIKHSEILKQNATFTKTSRICRLPTYLTIQFVRFFYKEKERVNAKILKDIKFPMYFDAFDLCTPELQVKLQPMREKIKELDNKEAKKAEENKEKEKALPHTEYSFPYDTGSNNCGMYKLQAVLTHKGRSSNSGHYVAWTYNHKTNIWYKCDDAEISPVAEEDVLNLSGGGDWHCAYLLLYGPRAITPE